MIVNATTTVWLIGDSTVQNYSQKQYPRMGWGQVLQDYCKTNVTVVNKAVGGRSTKSFLNENRWKPVVDNLNPGDFVMIQFGHNDQKKHVEKNYAPYDTLYKELLIKYINETKAKSAQPVLVTPVFRRVFKDGVLKNTLGKYPEAMREVAKETQTPLIDLHNISSNHFSQAGIEGTKEWFMHLPPGKYDAYPNGNKDNSHFQENGARHIATWIIEDAIKQNMPIAELFALPKSETMD